ncbi:ATP-binding SpoIIE family protein phosphatase [Aestuariibacter salexigens]|uniref:ATP-binding SpoIIE family protein phosphatase n=1 Tax=Aestuariibacter salexigens TaxID=226010 RepID=UPI00041FD943|nr:fused response regulator/phosphatase [Aestuariibacter salexigens]
MRILIVDDESLNRFLLLHMLEGEGYTECYEAESGHEALQLAEKINPDLVLLDVMMPDMDGYTLAPLLKKLSGDTYLPIIFITALDDQESLVKCLEVGGDDFASKPFDKVLLAAKIRAHSRTRLLSQRINSQHQELVYYRNAVEREHAIVEHIFNNAIKNNPKVAKFLDYRLTPATDFNGDLLLYEPSPSGGFYMLVGDFTGHGLASAIGALPVTRAFQAMVAKGLSVSEIVGTLNKTLLSLLPVEMFFAAAVLEVSASGKHFSVWNGSMPALLVASSDGSISHRFTSRHMALGILDPDEFEDQVEFFEAQDGDRLVAFSDGLVEIEDASGEMVGEDIVEQWLAERQDITVEQMYANIDTILNGRDAHDDITIVSYRCADLHELHHINTVSTLPFVIEATLTPDEIRNTDPVEAFIELVASQNGLAWLRSQLFTVLTELYNNAVDHGLLGLSSSLKSTTEGFMQYYEERMQRLETLSSGYIILRAGFDPLNRSLRITVMDSGKGFNVGQVSDADEEDMFGRGIPMLLELCDSLDYRDGGKTAEAIMSL